MELTVIRRVFEGGEGWLNGGRSERSRESGGDLLLLDEGLDEFLVAAAILSFSRITLQGRKVVAKWLRSCGVVEEALYHL